MRGMKDGRKGSGCAVVLIIGFVLVLLPTIYVLSVGPAVRLCDDGHFSRETLHWIYHPIAVAELKSTWFMVAIESYIELWKR